MVSRRQALSGMVSVTAAIAGCNSLIDTPPPDRDAPSNTVKRPENVAMNPSTIVLRRSGSRDSLVDVTDATGDLNQTERDRRQAVERGFVTTPDAVSLLTIDDVEGANKARQFLADTDFSSAFVFVDTGSVPQCYERRLCYVTWTASELQRAYARVYRDYDVACRTDARDDVARFIRLDGTIDSQQIRPGQTAIHSDRCPIPRWKLDTRRGNGTHTGDRDHDNDTTDGNQTTDTNARLAGGP